MSRRSRKARPWYLKTLEQGDASVRAQVAEALQQQRTQGKKKAWDHIGCVVEFIRGGQYRCGQVRMSPRKERSLYVLDQDD